MRIRGLFAAGLLALTSTVVHGADQTIYFDVPASGSSYAEMVFSTTATQFNFANPKDTTGQNMASGNTFYYRNGTAVASNSYPHVAVSLSSASGVLTLRIEYWINSSLTAAIPDYPGGAGTWRFIIVSPPSSVTPGFTGGAALNNAPTATISPTSAPTPAFDRTYAVLSLGASQDVTFSVSWNDAEGDGPGTSYSWSDDGTAFGSGQAGPTRTFTASSTHAYTIAFSATEDFPKADFPGRPAPDSITLVVKNAPTADIKYNTDGSATYVAPPSPYKAVKTGDTIYLSADDSSTGDPLAGGSLAYDWDYGDGTTPHGNTSHVSHSYTTRNDYMVRLKVTDRYGFPSAETTMRVVVADTPVAALQYKTNVGAPYSSPPATPVIISSGDTVYFSGTSSVSNDPLGGALTYEWDYDGNGTVDESTTGTPSNKYLLCDSYSAKLRVTNQEGFPSSWVSMRVAVRSHQVSQFPAHIGLPHTYLPPTTDGFVRGTGPGSTHDTGWTGAYALTYNAETTTDATFQALRNKSAETLYVSYEIVDPNDSGSSDFAVLGFWPDGPSGASANLATARLIVVYPRAAGAAQLKVYQSNASGAWSELNSTQVSAINIEKGVVPSGTGWVIELAIPSSVVTDGGGTVLWPQISTDFYFYSNAHVFDGSQGRQYFWPKDLQTLSFADVTNVQNSVPSPYIWGLSHKSAQGAGTGLWIDSANIGVHPTGGSGYGRTIKPNEENEFVARVQNDTTRWDPATNTEQHPAADGVSVEFRIANWGLGTEWIPIPGNDPPAACPDSTFKNNPTCPAQVPGMPDASTPGEWVYSMRWNPGILPVNIDASNGHQCLKAEILSTSDTYIKEESAWTNMNFEGVTGSGFGAGFGDFGGFRGRAYIGNRGFRPLPPGPKPYHLLLKVEKNFGVRMYAPLILDEKKTAPTMKERPYAEWVVKGYLDTGKTVVVNGRSYPTLEPVGSFGYHIDLDRVADDLEYTLDGLTPVGKDTYAVALDAGETKTITYTLKPVAYTWSVSVHGGAAIPLAGFNASYSTGVCGILDAGYSITRQCSIELMAGWSWLPAASSGGTATSMVTVSLDARYTHWLSRTMLAYVQAGPSLLAQDFATAAPGYSAGLGIGVPVSQRLVLEVGADFYSTFSQRDLLILAHAGISLRL